jgi:NAD(P)-dependent dehydrogenase (short-subunit alcohol dehydrogenase family)
MTVPRGRGVERRVALVTGAGRGLGAAHAAALAAAGVAVVVNDSGVDLLGEHPDPTVAEKAAGVIREAGGIAVADDSDVAGFDGARAAVERAVAEFGRIDIVVNNAGIVAGAALDELTEAELRGLLDVHVVGTVGTIRAAFPRLREQGWGRIVNTTSEAALATDLAAGMAYATAKAAVWGATMAAAQAGAEHGVTANAISPGALTRMSAPFLERTPSPPGLDLSPRRVAEVVAALCAEDAGDITGRVVHVAGGHVREYVLRRSHDTELARRLGAAVTPPDQHLA